MPISRWPVRPSRSPPRPPVSIRSTRGWHWRSGCRTTFAKSVTSAAPFSKRTTPHSLSWIIFTDADAGGLEWSGPAAYVKIRDGLYFMYWLEEACNGTLGTILVNLHTMRDVGVGYSCGPNGLSMSAVGAHERLAGRFDIARFYQVKTGGAA